MSGLRVRQPAVSGSFYPSSPARCGELAAALFAAAGQLPLSGPDVPAGMPAGILVPHAGLVYSGVTAAAAWRTLGAAPDTEPEADAGEPGADAAAAAADGRGGPLTVVILGTNHVSRRLRGIAVWDEAAWAIPGGEVAVNRPSLARSRRWVARLAWTLRRTRASTPSRCSCPCLPPLRRGR